MAGPRPLPPFAAIVVAAGKGLRAGGSIAKQYRQWHGKPLLRHSVETLAAAGADPVIVMVAADAHDTAHEAIGPLRDVRLLTGGATRQASVRAGMEALAEDDPERVLIHDAARPDLPRDVIERLLEAIEDAPGAIPVLPVVDSLAMVGENEVMSGRSERDALRRVQTPQAFRYADILAAHRCADDDANAGDDAQLLHAAGGTVRLVAGDERLVKITFASDFADTPVQTALPARIGQGFDVHRLVRGEELWLCGVRIEHEMGLAGHSDADVALHAITDAILGAIGEGDIGTHFPPSDQTWAGAASGRFLEHAVELAREAGYHVGNIDLTIICEAPRIGPHRPAMRREVARLAAMCEDAVSIKATTTEALGFTGRAEGIAAQAIAMLHRAP